MEVSENNVIFEGDCLEKKIKVYVSSFKTSTLDYVDAGSMGHPCVTTRHAESMFTEYKHLPKGSWDGYLTDDEMKAIDVVGEFCEENGLECEVVDMTSLAFISKMKLMFKGMKAPTISFEGKKIEGIPTKEDLKTLVSK